MGNHLYHLALVALRSAPGEMTLRDLARALGVTDSSMQYALRKLAADGLAAKTNTRYRIVESPRTSLELQRARFEASSTELMKAAANANPAVALAAFDERGGTLHYFPATSADSRALIKFEQAIAVIEPTVTAQRHDPLLLERTTVEGLTARKSQLEVLSSMTPIKGDLDKFVPTIKTDPTAQKPLGRPNPELELPSRREKQRLALKYDLDELSIFGSSARSDFRPNSDVDAIVHFRGGAVPTMSSVSSLSQDLSELFRRPVDVIDANSVEAAFLSTINRDRVTLYGKPHPLVPRTSKGIRESGG